MYESDHFSVITSVFKKSKGDDIPQIPHHHFREQKIKNAQRYQTPQLAYIMEGKGWEGKKGWESNPTLSTFKGFLYSIINLQIYILEMGNKTKGIRALLSLLSLLHLLIVKQSLKLLNLSVWYFLICLPTFLRYIIRWPYGRTFLINFKSFQCQSAI